MNRLPKRPRLDYATASQAVADYQLIVSYGALGQFRAELTVAYREAEAHRLRRPIGAHFAAEVIAHDLARLADLDPAELMPAVRLYLMGDDRTAVVLRLLRDFAERVRNELRAQTRKGA